MSYRPSVARSCRAFIAAGAVAALALISAPAFADNLVNNVTVGGTDTFVAPGSTTVGYKINTAAAGDPQSGCNVTDGSPATVTLSVPAGVTASTTSLIFSACNAIQNVTFSSSTPGNYAINVTAISDSGTGSYINQANWTLHVTAPADTTAPVLTLPSDITKEATSAAGAAATYSASATDAVDGSVAVTCSPVSGSTFALGSTTVTCSAKDSHNNTATGSFHVVVQDTTAPAIHNVPSDITTDATSASGAVVTFDSATASDAVDPAPSVSYSKASGSTFAIGATTVTIHAKDAAGNESSASFKVTVVDQAPIVTVPSNMSVEAEGASGAAVTFSASATDVVDGSLPVTCDPASGATFGFAPTTVTCTATDSADNVGSASFTVTVSDTTSPVLTVPADFEVEATSAAGAVVTYTASALDLVDGAVTPDCSPASGSTFDLGPTLVTCTATDQAGNASDASTFTVTVVDTTAPALHLPANITKAASSSAGAVATFTASADDIVDGSVPVTCVLPSGSTFAPGTSTVSCSASDAKGNAAHGSFTVTVTFGWNGFFAPVDVNGVLNTIKGGQTVPLKWSIPNGSGGWISSLDVVRSIKYGEFTCSTVAPTDDIETTATGGTVLRYDTTANQYIYNWQTPKTAGKCYKLTVTLTDDTTHTALFKTK